jgi:hypothetical protein
MRISTSTAVLCSVIALTALRASLARAVPVPVDEPGQSPSGGNSSGASSDDDATCTLPQIDDCLDMGGVVDQGPQACWCEIYEWVPRRVINASDGDVGLVPIDGRGSEVVTALTQAIGQLHRHSVMFYGAGSYARHDTMYLADGEDGSSADPGGDYVPVLTPLIGNVRFDPDALKNGLPGAISQSIDDIYDRGRLAATGLILKPALTANLEQGGFHEPDRARFEAAVSAARATHGYYKLSDYTHEDSMDRTWSTSRSGDLRGSHCSGYVAYFYRAQGLSLGEVSYPRSLRNAVGELLFDDVRDACRDETGFWDDLLATLSGHWSACTNIANQVVNCFGDLGCGNVSDDWRTQIGTGAAVSPDNLLPASFRYYGLDHDYAWEETTLSTASVNGTSVAHPGLTGAHASTSANSASPFKRVEALRYSGGYLTRTDRIRL